MNRAALVIVPLVIILLAFLFLHHEPRLPAVSVPEMKTSVTAHYSKGNYDARLGAILAMVNTAGRKTIPRSGMGRPVLNIGNINAPPHSVDF